MPTALGRQVPNQARIGIIGAGPAGLSAACLLKRRGYSNVTVLEKTGHLGGKSRSFNFKGRIHDIGTFM